ncbi:TetR/AcrR family transcriptional regulator [Euzebya sp.]|uniref:TetR/AcrR family transcriptional regulator n=1 Tax=Euzebya sp. TaxID=1971409 RepID=UPI003514EF43
MSTTSPAAGASSRRSHRAAAGEGDRLRDELMDAAERLLGERGNVDSVSLRQVAREVGVSATSVYLHFADKDDLFVQVCHRRFTALADHLRLAREGLASPAAQLRACGRAYVRFGLERPAEYTTLFTTLPMAKVVELVDPEELIGLRTLEEMAGIVAAGVEAGELRDVDPFTTAVSLWATVHGLVTALGHGLGEVELDADAVTDHTLDLLLDGLRRPERQPARSQTAQPSRSDSAQP